MSTDGDPVVDGSRPSRLKGNANDPFSAIGDGSTILPTGFCKESRDGYIAAVADLPWTARQTMEPGTTYVVLASYLPLSHISSTVRFFRAVSALRKQLAEAQGLVGYTLRAKPLARHYWTLSVWESDEALQAFVRTPPHSEVMRALKPLLDSTKFAEWQITSANGQPAWNDALEHLDSSA